ncbi:MAG: O-antigen ligase family protein [Vicinamibacterales bacterium]
MLRTILVLAILSSGLIAGVFSRYAALLLYLWFAMFRPVEWVWVDLTPFRLSLVVGALLVVPSLLSGIFPALLHPLGIGSVLFVGFSLLAQIDAVRPAIGWLWIDYISRLVLVSLLIAPIATTPRRVLMAIGVFSGSFLFHGVKAGLASLMGGGDVYGAGLSGAFIDNNGYAVGTAMAMFLFVGVAQALPQRLLRWSLMCVAPLGGMAVVSLFSRGGLLALAAGTTVFILLQRRALGMALGALVVVATVVSLPRPAGYEERISPLVGDTPLSEDLSARSRMHFWRVAVDMALARPFGVGLWNYAEAYNEFDFSAGLYGPRRSVHSSHLQVLAETGFGGFAAYVFLLGWSIRLLFRVRARGRNPDYSVDERRMYTALANGAIASIVAFLVGGATISLALNDMTWFTFGSVVALDRLKLEQHAPAVPEVFGAPTPVSATLT